MHSKEQLRIEIDGVCATMARLVIQQSDIDNQLTHLDKQRSRLEKELEALK